MRIQLFYKCNNKTVHYNCNTTILLWIEHLTSFIPCSTVSIVTFEQINASWASTRGIQGDFLADFVNS